jgi:hypothetical protein
MELSEAEPNRLKMCEKLVAMEALVRDISLQDNEIQMPGFTFEEFSNRLAEIETQAIESKHSKLKEVRPRIERLRADGNEAWRSRDRIAWLGGTKQIDSIAFALKPELSSEEWSEQFAMFILVRQLPEATAGWRKGARNRRNRARGHGDCNRHEERWRQPGRGIRAFTSVLQEPGCALAQAVRSRR